MLIARLVLIFVLPLDFHGRVRVVRSIYLPAALHGIEASLLPSRLLRWYLALLPSQIGRAYRLLEMVGEGSPDHGPIRLLSAGAAEIGFRWDLLALDLVCPCLVIWLDLFSVSRLLFLMLGVIRFQLIFVIGSFRAGPLLDVPGSLQLLNSSHVRERDKGFAYGWWCLEWFFAG